MSDLSHIFLPLQNEFTIYKVHFATGPKGNDPLIAFLQGKFKDWQEWQSKRNFERNYILSLIYYDVNEWLFAGFYKSKGCELVNDHYEYDTELLNIQSHLIGRLIIQYQKDYRQSYVYLENCAADFEVSQVLKNRYSIIEFPGYEKVIINFNYLQTIFKNNDTSWYTALKNIKGVYLITDITNGKQYVGSVYGEYAFWTRWGQYSESGHGGNVELIRVLNECGAEYAQNFQFSILEIRSRITDDMEIIQREQHWKNILLSNQFGYNRN
jgi:GIY-YIG catalytic domain